MYVLELINPIIKFRIFLSDNNATYNIPAIDEIKGRNPKSYIKVRIIHNAIIEPNNMVLKFKCFILTKLTQRNLLVKKKTL